MMMPCPPSYLVQNPLFYISSSTHVCNTLLYPISWKNNKTSENANIMRKVLYPLNTCILTAEEFVEGGGPLQVDNPKQLPRPTKSHVRFRPTICRIAINDVIVYLVDEWPTLKKYDQFLPRYADWNWCQETATTNKIHIIINNVCFIHVSNFG